MKSFTAGPNENGVRLSRFVEGVTKDMPRSMMYKAFRNKRIKVNGKRAEPDTRLSAGDLIELYINDEFFPVGKPTAKTAKPRRQPPVTVENYISREISEKSVEKFASFQPTI